MDVFLIALAKLIRIARPTISLKDMSNLILMAKLMIITALVSIASMPKLMLILVTRAVVHMLVSMDVVHMLVSMDVVRDLVSMDVVRDLVSMDVVHMLVSMDVVRGLVSMDVFLIALAKLIRIAR